MDATIKELLDLVVRWVHLIAGIMWIGNLSLFNRRPDRNLTPFEQPKEGVEGEIRLLHSGGFYEVEKEAIWRLTDAREAPLVQVAERRHLDQPAGFCC